MNELLETARAWIELLRGNPVLPPLLVFLPLLALAYLKRIYPGTALADLQC